ncbi:MAG TPA: hypothetical protein VFR94_07115, partial [Nitrososphaeraceae archaeon]|nr:hypothetical protein [Nitrososphaeraceae archaeon]
MKTGAGEVSRIIFVKRMWQQLFKFNYYCVPKVNLVVLTALLMISMITTPTILQPTLGTTNLSPNNNTTTTTTDTEYNSFMLVPLNQSSTSLADKTNVTLRGLFNVQVDPGRWNQLLQPALDELNRRHPDMNIELEYIEFFYPGTRNQILDRLSKGETVDIISIDQ